MNLRLIIPIWLVYLVVLLPGVDRPSLPEEDGVKTGTDIGVSEIREPEALEKSSWIVWANIESTPVVEEEIQPERIPEEEDKGKDVGFRIVRAKVTAYCPCSICCGSCSPGITSTGSSAYIRGAAVDPRSIPYGTELGIPGYGHVRADDTGGAMRRASRRGIIHIDVRMTSHREALNWGVQWLDVKIF